MEVKRVLYRHNASAMGDAFRESGTFDKGAPEAAIPIKFSLSRVARHVPDLHLPLPWLAMETLRPLKLSPLVTLQ